MRKNENRPGYKNSKVGWIPDDWGISTFGREFQIQLGKMLKQNAVDKKPKHPYLANINVRWGSFELSNLREMTFSESEKEKFSLKQGDILVCEGGEIGRCAIWNEELKPCYFQKALHRLRPSNTNTDRYFTMYFLCVAFTSSRIKGLIGETSIAHFTRECFVTFPLALPPLPEQKAIAAVLECWDRGIRNLELKIEKKRLIKKGLMQRLLSGKQRLKGFSKEWKCVRLGDVFEFISSYAFSRECLTTEAIDNSDIYNIHYGDIHATYTGPILDLAKERRVPMLITSDALPDKLEFLQEGDLVMADVSEDYEGIGACIELKNLTNKKLTGGLHTFVMRDQSGQTAAGFRGYMFKEYRLAKELKRIATGVSVYSLSKTNLAKIELLLPPLNEQQSITSVLWGADEEIAALEKKMVLWKEQKKYLLNNLVTGTIRLPQFCIKA
jgi:type I restriction enzyme S subunit